MTNNDLFYIFYLQETDDNLNFDEMILEAAKSIIAATSALVRAASAAQRELIDQVHLVFVFFFNLMWTRRNLDPV